jgi:hypothetical protein
MNADKPVSRLPGWLNARISHRHICVHLRLFAAKILLFVITNPSRTHPDNAQTLGDRTHRRPPQPRRSNPPVLIP